MLTAYLAADATPDEQGAVRAALQRGRAVTSTVFVSKDHAYRGAKEAGLTVDPRSVKAFYRSTVTDVAAGTGLATTIRRMAGVDSVTVFPAPSPTR